MKMRKNMFARNKVLEVEKKTKQNKIKSEHVTFAQSISIFRELNQVRQM